MWSTRALWFPRLVDIHIIISRIKHLLKPQWTVTYKAVGLLGVIAKRKQQPVREESRLKQQLLDGGGVWDVASE